MCWYVGGEPLHYSIHHRMSVACDKPSSNCEHFHHGDLLCRGRAICAGRHVSGRLGVGNHRTTSVSHVGGAVAPGPPCPGYGDRRPYAPPP